MKGRIYIYLDNTDICLKFLQDAESEGYHFGKIRPTESGGSDIIALEKNKQLSYVGFVGHMAFQCNGGSDNSGFYRIDYRKFSNGDRDYLFKGAAKLQMKELCGKFYERVTVIGDDFIIAADYINNNLAKCETIEHEENLYTKVSYRFSVTAIEE